MPRVAVVGAGYWGPNLVRNFRASPDWELAAVCDLDEARARKVVGDARGVDVETSLERLLARDDVDAVAIATPANTHRPIAMAALESGKHVLVEKPLASSVAEATEMVEAARERGLVLMADHTYCYTPVVQRIRQIVGDGELGEILFVDSVRINLGLVQPDVDVIWDLAPHDLSILDVVLPGGLSPEGVAAHGADPIGAGPLLRRLPHDAAARGARSPTSTSTGSARRRSGRWSSAAHAAPSSGTTSTPSSGSASTTAASTSTSPRAPTNLADRTAAGVSYRLGDMYAPSLPEKEALGTMVAEFAAAIAEGRAPLTDGQAGLRVLQVLEAASTSLADGGRLVDPSTTTVRSH